MNTVGHSISSFHFEWPDYVVLALILLISALIGIYYACTGDKQNSTAEFLMGGRSLGTLPVAMSLLASFVSANSLIGIPAEVYFFGTQVTTIVVSYLFVMPLTAYLYMPIFYKLQVTSTYEYLELRFGKLLRCLCSGLYTIQLLMLMAIVLYGPSLAFNQVTGIDVLVAQTVLVLVCIFYTSLGGIKAVVWTDTLQVIVMYGSVIAILTKGYYDAGGPAAVWEANQRSGRIEFFNFDFDPKTRLTVWNTVLGDTIFWLATYAVSQTHVQRYVTIPTIEKARRAIWINMVAITTLVCACFSIGMILYAKYEHCDPLIAKLITKPDQIVPFFVMEVLGNYSGLPGLFIAGTFSASLSTVSSGLNSLAAIGMEDFLRPYFLPEMADKSRTKLLKLIAIFYGIVCLGFSVLFSQVQSIIAATTTFYGLIGGPLLAVFTLGIFFPWANTAGTSLGLIVSIAVMGWIGFGTLSAESAGKIQHTFKYLSAERCPGYTAHFTNITAVPTMASNPESEVLSVYWLSHAWYPAYGYAMAMLIGIIVSLLYKRQDPKKLDPKLVCNLGDTVFRFLPKKAREFLRFKVGDEFARDIPCYQSAPVIATVRTS